MGFCRANIPTIMHDITSVSGLGINDVWMGRPADPQVTDQLLGSNGPSQKELWGLVSKRSDDFNVGFSQELERGQEEIQILSSINRHETEEGMVQEYQEKLFEADVKVSHEDAKRILTALQGNHSRWDQLKKDIDQLAAEPSSIPSAPPMELVMPSEDHQKERLEDYRARRQQEEKDRLLRVKECQANEDKKIQDMQQASIESIQEQMKKNATLGQLVLAARRRRENENRPTLSKVKEAILTTFKKEPSTKYPGNELLKGLHQDRMERHDWSKQMMDNQKIDEQAKEKQRQDTYKFYSAQNDVRQANIEGVSLAEYLAKKSS